MDNLLILLLIPLVSAALLALLRTSSSKWMALGASLVNVAATVPFLCSFSPDGGMQFEQSWVWMQRLGVSFHIGVDGIGLPLVLLTNGLIPLIVLATWRRQFSATLYALVLSMQGGLLLVFMALDAFTFYVGWEIALIPIYFICALWGSGDRIRVNLKFFVYTFLGSILMLVALIYLYQQTPNQDLEWSSFTALELGETEQRWLFWAFFLAFAIKIPILPFHSWQPDTYTYAPAVGTMLLSGIMLKMGVFGVLRWLIPVVPAGVMAYGQVVMVLSIAGVIYASLIAFKQNDAKRLIAYSSIAHVGLITAGVFSLNEFGLQGAMIQMVNHGISVVALFFVIDIIEQRVGSRDISTLGGLAPQAPSLAIVFLVITMGAIGLPLTNGFVGEFLLLKGLFSSPINGMWYALFGGTTLILGAIYMLRFYNRAMLGTAVSKGQNIDDIKGSELIVLLVIVGLIVFIGVMPNYLLEMSEPTVKDLLKHFES